MVASIVSITALWIGWTTVPSPTAPLRVSPYTRNENFVTPALSASDSGCAGGSIGLTASNSITGAAGGRCVAGAGGVAGAGAGAGCWARRTTSDAHSSAEHTNAERIAGQYSVAARINRGG